LWNEFFSSAPQLKRDPLDGAAAGAMTEGSRDSDAAERTPPLEDTSGAVQTRLPGCLLGFLFFIFLLSLPDILRLAPPRLVLSAIGIVLGVACVGLYGRVVRRRWGVTPPDVVQMVGRDLAGVRRRALMDYRLRFGVGWSWRERGLHEVLYGVKWLGHFLIIAGLGSLFYRLFVQIGLVQ